MSENDSAARAWQTGIWDRMSSLYQREIDRRFAPAVARVVELADLRPGQRVLDLGTGTGAAAERAAKRVAPGGTVIGVDPSRDMLALAERRIADLGLGGAAFLEGRGESIPAGDASFDAVIASLSLMFALDRAAAAREIARVLRPRGRFVASVWGGPDECDLIRFQQIAGSFAPEPPVAGVGPGALGDPTPFVAQLADAGIAARVEHLTITFDFPDLDAAWAIFANVTASQLSPERLHEAKAAVHAGFGDGEPVVFRNEAHFIVGTRG